MKQKIRHQNLLYIFFLILISILGYFVYPFFSALALFWTLVYYVALKSDLLRKLSFAEKNIYLLTIFCYPIIEVVIKFIIIREIIPNSWFWLNRIEHFLSAVSILILFLPFIKSILIKLKPIESFVFIVTFVSFIGMTNEFIEYFLRIIMGLNDAAHFSAYYPDTIYDMMINTLGAAFGYFLITKIQNSYEKAILQRDNSNLKRRRLHF